MGKQFCRGKIEREGMEWYCLCCGHTSTSWTTQHVPLQAKYKYLAQCAIDVLNEERR